MTEQHCASNELTLAYRVKGFDAEGKDSVPAECLLRWLRDEKKVYLNFQCRAGKDNTVEWWCEDIIDNSVKDSIIYTLEKKVYPTYEDCVDATLWMIETMLRQATK